MGGGAQMGSAAPYQTEHIIRTRELNIPFYSHPFQLLFDILHKMSVVGYIGSQTVQFIRKVLKAVKYYSFSHFSGDGTQVRNVKARTE